MSSLSVSPMSMSPAKVKVSIDVVFESVIVKVVAAAPVLSEVIASSSPAVPKVIPPLGSTDIAIAPSPSASIKRPFASVAVIDAPSTTSPVPSSPSPA